MEGYIYLLTDTTNGKQYVGQHHYDSEELDPNYHGSGRIISNIYNRRPETIKEEYLKTCYSKQELNEWEKYFIITFDTLYPNGYNLTEGGEGGVPSEETRRKLSEALKGRVAPNKGKPMSEESRRKMSEAAKGRVSPNKGKHFSEESRRKMSDAHRGRQCGKENPFFGKHHSEESRRKIGEATKIRQCGKENPFFGKHHSEESRRKMSEAAKRRCMLKRIQPDGCLQLW